MKYPVYLILIILLVSCSKIKEEKKLYPVKVLAGDTKHQFHYSRGRIYSVTTNKPEYNGTFLYTYHDEYFKQREHPLKNYIFEIIYEPDHNVAGWDSNDSVISIRTMMGRGTNPVLLSGEEHFVNIYRPERSPDDTANDRRMHFNETIKHKYNKENQLIESTYLKTEENNIHFSVGIPTKRIVYDYRKGKLAKASYYEIDKTQPYQVIEVEYDDQPGYLKNLPLEVRFLPVELPYRHHNITSIKVMDGNGKLNQDLSYTCSYTYSKSDYPNTFTQKMANGKEIKGYMVYKAVTIVQKLIASAN